MEHLFDAHNHLLTEPLPPLMDESEDANDGDSEQDDASRVQENEEPSDDDNPPTAPTAADSLAASSEPPKKRMRLSDAAGGAVIPDHAWFQSLHAYLHYRTTHPTNPIPSLHSSDEHERTIAKWIALQKQYMRRYQSAQACMGTKSKIETLLRIADFPWAQKRTEKISQYNNTLLEELRQFKAKHGHCNVHSKQNGTLGEWLPRLRTRRAAGLLSDELKNELDEIGMIWNRWEYMFDKLKLFYEEHGHTVVPYRKEDEAEMRSLAAWVRRQRKNYHGDKLNQGQIEKLELIGFDWSPSTTIAEGKRSRMVECVNNKFHSKFMAKVDKLVAYKQQHGHLNPPSRSEIGIVVHQLRCLKSNGTLPQFKIDKLNEIGFAWSDWEYNLQRIKEHYEQFGHFNVSRLSHPGRKGLFSWVSRQRKLYKLGQLSQERVDELNAIGFDWESDVEKKEERPKDPFLTKSPEERVQEYLQMLKAYKEKHGDCNVSSRDGRLGSWLCGVVQKYRCGELNADLQRQLQELGVDWGFRRDNQWDESYAKLKAYREEHGTCHVPYSRNPEYQYNHLSAWVGFQRRNYKSQKISQERVDRLNELGFDWNMPQEAIMKEREAKRQAQEEATKAHAISLANRLEENLKLLRAYKEEHGHCNVPSRQGKLGNFVRRMRRKCHEGTLDHEVEAQLVEIGLDLHPCRDNMWISSYEQLKAYRERHGHCNVPSSRNPNDEYKHLAGWVYHQRKRYKIPGKLSNDRIAMLEELGFDWALERERQKSKTPLKSLSERGAEHLEEIKAFKEKHGHCRIPTASALGRWVSDMRRYYRNGELEEDFRLQFEEIVLDSDHSSKTPARSLPKHQSEHLEELKAYKGVDSDHSCKTPVPSLPKRQLEHLEELKAYKEKHGHCRVPCYTGKLGRWLVEIRCRYRKGKLDVNLQSQLEEIGVELDLKRVKVSNHFENLKELEAYLEEHGHCDVLPGEGKLGRWLVSMRQKYQRGTLGDDLETKLLDLGVDLNPPLDSMWLESYEQLKAFREKHGHCSMPTNDKRFKSLADWCYRQRKKYQIPGKLGKDRIMMLESIGFDWNMPSTTDQKEREKMLQVVRQNTPAAKVSAPVAKVSIPVAVINTPVAKVNTPVAKVSTPVEKVSTPVDKVDATWNLMYNKLKACYRKSGRATVPSTYFECDQLVPWVHKQRNNYKNDKLKKGQITKLNNIGFLWDPLQKKKFDLPQQKVSASVKSHSEQVQENMEKLKAIKEAKVAAAATVEEK